LVEATFPPIWMPITCTIIHYVIVTKDVKWQKTKRLYINDSKSKFYVIIV
jgi:hypothetical protein